MAYSGKYTPQHPEKYNGDTSKIVYRSLLERRFMVFCDTNPNIVSWASEEFHIPYVSPKDGRWHRYFPDFWIKAKKDDGTFEETIIEVKPFKQCYPPKPPKSGRKTRRFLKESVTYAVNQAKWDAAKALCKKNNIQWKVLTEKDLTPKKGR